MPNLPRAEEGQRIDLTEWEDLNEVPALFDEAQGTQFFTAPSQTFIIDGFDITNPSSKNLQVDLGRALLGTKEKGQLRYGRLAFEGDSQKTLDLTSFSVGTYGVYIRFDYVDGEFQNRIFWNDTSSVEFAKTVATRRVANWSLTVANVSPGAEWTKIAEVEVLASPPLNIRKERPFYFEGPELGTVTSSGTAASIGVTNGLQQTVNVTGLTGISSASIGRYLAIEGAADPANNGNFRIVDTVSSTEAVLRVPSTYPGSDANNGSIIWTQSAAYAREWGEGANDRDSDRATYGIKDFRTWVQFVNRKLDEIQTGGNPDPTPLSRGRWDTPLHSLDDVLPLAGSLNSWERMRGGIDPDTDGAYTLGDRTVPLRWNADLNTVNVDGVLTVFNDVLFDTSATTPQFRPDVSGIMDLGLSANRFRSLYLQGGTLDILNPVVDALSVTGIVGTNRGIYLEGGWADQDALVVANTLEDRAHIKIIDSADSTQFVSLLLNASTTNSGLMWGLTGSFFAEHGAGNFIFALDGQGNRPTVGLEMQAGHDIGVQAGQLSDIGSSVTPFDNIYATTLVLDPTSVVPTTLTSRSNGDLVLDNGLLLTGDLEPAADNSVILGSFNYLQSVRTYNLTVAGPGASPTSGGATFVWDTNEVMTFQPFTGATALFSITTSVAAVVDTSPASYDAITVIVGGNTRYLRAFDVV